jgi:hypothetical protein
VDHPNDLSSALLVQYNTNLRRGKQMAACSLTQPQDRSAELDKAIKLKKGLITHRYTDMTWDTVSFGSSVTVYPFVQP